MSNWGQPPGFSEPGIFNGFFGGLPFFVMLIFVLVIGFFVFVIIKGLVGWSKNNASPLTTVNSTVIGRRTEVWGGSGDSSASTNYYITFETEYGERIEMYVSGTDYGLIVEGDRGRLSYQGTRFKGFERMPQRVYGE